MNFELPVAIYVRLAGLTRRRPDSVGTDEEWNALQCVRLEHTDGHIYALASNRKIAAVYYLGAPKTPMVNGAVHLVIDNKLLAQCNIEKPFNSVIQITAVPELKIVSLKTTLGFQHVGNGGVFAEKSPLDNWRKWANEKPVTASKGAMHWNLEWMEALNAASPSGRIDFPEFIDADKPVTLRDHQDPNWCGLFMCNLANDKGQTYTTTPAVLPDWWTR